MTAKASALTKAVLSKMGLGAEQDRLTKAWTTPSLKGTALKDWHHIHSTDLGVPVHSKDELWLEIRGRLSTFAAAGVPLTVAEFGNLKTRAASTLCQTASLLETLNDSRVNELAEAIPEVYSLEASAKMIRLLLQRFEKAGGMPLGEIDDGIAYASVMQGLIMGSEQDAEAIIESGGWKMSSTTTAGGEASK